MHIIVWVGKAARAGKIVLPWDSGTGSNILKTNLPEARQGFDHGV